MKFLSLTLTSSTQFLGCRAELLSVVSGLYEDAPVEWNVVAPIVKVQSDWGTNARFVESICAFGGLFFCCCRIEEGEDDVHTWLLFF